MDNKDKLSDSKVKTPVVILVRPQLGENIGTSARAMANFGLENLRLVAPRDGWPSDTAKAAAAGADWIIEKTQVFDDVNSAIADLHKLYATTARPRDMVKTVMTPERAAADGHDVMSAGQRIGFLFGAERAGLQNDEIAVSDAIVMAPVNPDFASLNLAQAVLLMGYEWHKFSQSHSLGRKTAFDGPAREGLNMRESRPATKADLAGLFEHLESELDDSGFLKPPEKRPIMVRNLRSMFLRMGATEQEIKTLRGVVASLTRVHKRRRDLP